MTISMAWIRERGRYEELLFCSDSRLRFGCAWDSCQKIFPLPRGDCAISFAGDTHFAFPFIHTAINAVSLHRGSRNRLIDITVAKGYLLNAINSMLTEIGDLRSNQEHHDEPVLRLIFGGYSWIEKKFVSWLFYYNPGERKFIEGPMGQWRGLGENRNLIIIGDPEASVSAVKRANRTGATVPDNENDVQQMAKDRFVERHLQRHPS